MAALLLALVLALLLVLRQNVIVLLGVLVFAL